MRIRPSLALLTVAGALVPALAAPGPAADQGLVGFHVEPLVRLSAQQKADLGVTGDHGVVVAAIVPLGPAAQAGLKPADRLLRFGPYDVPDLATLAEESHRLWRAAIRMMMDNARAGVPMELLVERDGKKQTLKLTPVTAAELHRLQADDATAGDLPALSGAGPAEPLSSGFEGLAAEALLPAGFFPYEGRWRVLREPESGNGVLRQDRMVLPWAVLLVAGKGRSYADGKASVRFMPVSGIADASGGIIFRAQDPKNYYIARPNALEDNFRIYVMKDGVRTQLGSVQVTPPERNTWHTLEVEFKGPSIRATMDGKDAVEARDETFAAGWCGLWTKADSVTLFDDLRVVPAK
jgi:hypothetical protein